MEVAWPTVMGAFCRSSAAAVPMVRLMLVAGVPVGHGEDVELIDLLFLRVQRGEA